MDFKSISLATLAGAVTLFVLGFLIYVQLGGIDMMFNGPEAATGRKAEVALGPIFLMEILYALLIAIIYQHWAKIRTFATGAKNGLWIGVILGGISLLDYFAATNLTSISGVVFGMVTYGVRIAIAAGVIGLVLGKLDAK